MKYTLYKTGMEVWVLEGTKGFEGRGKISLLVDVASLSTPIPCLFFKTLVRVKNNGAWVSRKIPELEILVLVHPKILFCDPGQMIQPLKLEGEYIRTSKRFSEVPLTSEAAENKLVASGVWMSYLKSHVFHKFLEPL